MMAEMEGKPPAAEVQAPGRYPIKKRKAGDDDAGVADRRR